HDMSTRRITLIAGSALLIAVTLTSCTSKPAAHAASTSSTTPTTQPRNGDDLQAAMDKLEESIHKPSAPFHASFKKSDSDGFTYECEADISPASITGEQIDSNPATKVGDDIFPANTRTRQLNGTPYGSTNFQAADGRMVKFSLDNIYTCTDGKTSGTHFEGTITKK